MYQLMIFLKILIKYQNKITWNNHWYASNVFWKINLIPMMTMSFCETKRFLVCEENYQMII